MPKSNFWAMLIMSFIYIGFLVDTAIKEGSKVVLDKVWGLVTLFMTAPGTKEENSGVPSKATEPKVSDGEGE